jgi:NAD(P)-dependent dehydrogenase (short-subunit alcohol dehydrogenase family)
MNRFNLTGRVALITGGNRGLGLAMARGFAEHGADLALAARDVPLLEQAADALRRDTGRRVEIFPCDVAERRQVDALGRAVEAAFGKVDILVNNAGTNAPMAIDAIDDATWDRLIEINLNSCMALSRAVAGGMKARKWGRIIHISSIMGVISKEKRNVYSATKAALIGLAKASALDLGPFGVTVNCLAPGPFLTDLPMNMLSDAEKQAFASRTALGRWADPQELVGPALMLASDAGSYVSGTVLLVDGGYTAR